MPSMTSQARPELKRSRWPSFVAASFLTLVAFAQCGCDRAVPDSSGEKAFASRAESRLQGDVTVHAAVLTDDESRRYFGASLADEGIQPIWLSVENGGDSRLRFLPIITDPSYFSPPEVEQLLHSWWRGESNATIAANLVRAAMPEVIPQGRTVAGFVFTHREGGLKFLQVGFETDSQEFVFRFVLPVDGVSYAVQKVDFSKLYPANMVEAVDLAKLRERLEKLPCCTTDKSGHRNGDPFDLHSIYRTIRAFLFGSEYLNAPVSPLQAFGRSQDVSLQKARNTISLRNHLRLWLAPFTIEGLQVWVGQISRDIGVKLTTQSWYLTTHRISPAVDQDRFYLLQDMIMTGAVSRFGFVRGVGESSMPNPRVNLTGDPYVTDGLRLVLFLGEPRRTFDQIQFLEWERPLD